MEGLQVQSSVGVEAQRRAQACELDPPAVLATGETTELGEAPQSRAADGLGAGLVVGQACEDYPNEVVPVSMWASSMWACGHTLGDLPVATLLQATMFVPNEAVMASRWHGTVLGHYLWFRRLTRCLVVHNANCGGCQEQQQHEREDPSSADHTPFAALS